MVLWSNKRNISTDGLSSRWPLFSAVIFLFVFVACVTEIELDLPISSAHEVVILAKLEMSEENPFLKVEALKGYDRSSISERRVKIDYAFLENEQGESQEIPWGGDGLNQLTFAEKEMPLQAGDSYRLRIKVEDKEEFLSDWEIIPAPLDAINYRFKSADKRLYNPAENRFTDRVVVQIVMDSVEFSHSEATQGFRYYSSYAFKFLNNDVKRQEAVPFCYLTETDVSESKIQLYKRNGVQKHYTGKQVLETIADYKFEYGCYVEMHSQALSKSGMAYFEKLQLLNPDGGRLFQAKPGNIKSNFTSKNGEYVNGIFYISHTRLDRIFVSPEEARVPLALCPLFYIPPEIRYPLLLCYKCIGFENSSIEKPAFWVD